eukprot:m.33222 g.33222  ORF g.33222 m.33222 type:complete len:383 (-) comp10318_c0_seq1:135-1283(-)
MAKARKTSSMLEVEQHGTLGVGCGWEAPRLVAQCEDEARPGYATKKAHEYHDTKATLVLKVKQLADLVRQSRNCIVYSGAGISTASGIGDYATKAKKSLDARPKLRSPVDALPTKAHRVLVQMHARGMLKKWINQNHDGLPQKAGLPQEAMNEIHGAWYDPTNPVVKMSGELRDDLFDDLCHWENTADLCLALGTSLCGMNADRLATTPAEKAASAAPTTPPTLGTVIITLQQTQYDSDCQLRIYAPLDKVFVMLAEELGLDTAGLDRSPALYEPQPGAARVAQDVFEVPYDSDGKLCPGTKSRLNLRADQPIRLTSGPHAGATGVVSGKNAQGHYNLRVDLAVKKGSKVKHPVSMRLGLWYVTAAANGALAEIPVVNYKIP